LRQRFQYRTPIPGASTRAPNYRPRDRADTAAVGCGTPGPRYTGRQQFRTSRHSQTVHGQPRKLTPDGRTDLLDALARFSYFDRWSDEQRRDCCHRAQIRQFEPDQTVFVEGQAPVNYAHFMLSGECGLLQCLKLHRWRDSRTATERYRLSRAQPTEDEITRFHRRRAQRVDALHTVEPLPAVGYVPLPLLNFRRPSGPPPTGRDRIEYHFVDIATYSRGSVFGIGEHMVDRAVYARTPVQCLLIPRYWLLEKPQNRGNIWNRVRCFLEQRQPSRDRLFRWFLTELLWHRYRRQLVDDFRLVHAPRHLPRPSDVPLVCRIEECDVQRHDHDD
ncbi:uncharacterized protein LOC121589852, partial [Anopheles merus]|uniref:uncharacterized protein LOC121589852 n=1 Tax=Anopheles merus TaxID=30066 RepID=UPI001BE4008D